MSFGVALIHQLDIVAPPVRLRQPYVEPPTSRTGARQRLRFITSEKTGVSMTTAARLLGVRPSVIRGWLDGVTPSDPYKQKINSVYTRFISVENRVKVESSHKRSSKSVILKVRADALRVRNDEGDFRYWKPSYKWWPRFVARWVHRDANGLDEDWSEIISSWDYPEPWEPEYIESVEIV